MSLNIKTQNGKQMLASLGGNVINGAEMQHYSTEERMIGYWTDGKPIYRKVIQLPEVLIAHNQWAQVNVDVSFIELYINGYITNINGKQVIPVRLGGSNLLNIWYFGSADLQLTTNMYLILEYTKLADTPITNNNTYSTDEVLTGKTWIDGKPIYRKVIQCKMPKVNMDGTYPNNATYQISNVQTDYIMMINAYLIYDNDAGHVYQNMLYMNNAGYVAKAFTQIDSSSNLPFFICNTNGIAFSEKDVIAIVEYTKATD